MLLQIKFQGFILYVMIVVPWIGVLNPCFTIFIVDIYRKSLKRVFAPKYWSDRNDTVFSLK